MTSTSPTPLPVLRQPERCCQPGNCAYTPSRVRTILSYIRHLREHGDDPGEAAASSRGGDGGAGGASGGSGLAHGAARVWDVQQAQRAIGGRPSAEAIAARLCPYSDEADE